MNPTDTKLCKDCKFFEPYPAADEFTRNSLAKCGRSVLLPDLVVGGAPRRRFCEGERASTAAGGCGEAGQFFQPDDCDVLP